MSSACTPILVGVVSLVSEILQHAKTAKFSFRTMDYSPWSSKISIDRKNICKVGLVSSSCTPILVGVVSLVSKIPQPSKTANFPFRTMNYSPWSSKSLINRNRLKKFMQVGIEVKCMHTNFGGRGLSGFGDTTTLKNGQFSLSDHGL